MSKYSMYYEICLVQTFISFILFNLNVKAQKTIDTTAIINSIFPRGEKVTSGNNFNGAVWLNRFISPQRFVGLHCSAGNISTRGKNQLAYTSRRTNFDCYARRRLLPGKGKTQTIRKGDIIKCSPGVQHWRGASPDSEFAHLVVAPDVEKGEVTRLQRVADKEYKSLK